jgi:23S rRNA pseudouridine2605 synthase
MDEKLQKVLAGAGIASRRKCEEYIAAGRVSVNGNIATTGSRVDAQSDIICIDGKRIPVDPSLTYYLLNKERGIVSSASDPYGRPTVVGCMPSDIRLFPVGRLDVDSEGLILLTNDGFLTHRLTHPSYGVEKEYLVQVEGALSRNDSTKLKKGIELEDGTAYAIHVRMLSPDSMTVTVAEGRNRLVRRMCEAIGHPVTRLIRIRIGPLADRSLSPGHSRLLTDREVLALYDAVAKKSGNVTSGHGYTEEID